MNNKEFQKKWTQVVEKAWKDPKFKELLLSNPRKAFQEMGLKFPESFKLKVYENTKNELHFSLPEVPPKNLIDEELRKIRAAGGALAVTIQSGEV